MPAELDILPRLLALDAGKAFPIASHLQVAIHSDGLVLAPIAMAGEDTTVHCLAYGRVGQPPRVLSVPDPRQRDDQYRLFERLGRVVETYFDGCRRAGRHPQIWVSSSAGVAHLDTLADRLRFNKHNAAVKRLGELLAYATERQPLAGQQALHSATAALKLHWATGQDAAEDEHLGTLLTWINPPAGVPVLDAVASAELVPMGVKTAPEFDRDVLLPLVEAYNHARRTKTGSVVLNRLATDIHAALAPVATTIYDATQQTLQILRSMRLADLPDLAQLELREAMEFASYMQQRDLGYPVPLRDRPTRAAFNLTAREEAQGNAEAALLRGDRLALARAQLTGHVLVGNVANVRATALSPRKTLHTFELLSQQRVLRVRVRDELAWLDDPRLRVQVTAVSRTGTTTTVSVVLVSGQRAVGAPKVGQVLELSKQVPDWSRLARDRKHLSSVLAHNPWTHDSRGVPSATPRPAPTDPLAAVEALR